MSGYLPIPGSPDVVEGLAAGLRDEAQRVASAHERLLSVRHGTRWEGPAGRAFAARVQALPPLMDAVAQRYAGAAAALRTFAAELREAQDACNAAITQRDRGVLRRDRYGEEAALAEAGGSPADLARVPALRGLMVQGAAEVLDAERRYLEAHQRFHAADQRCRRALGALADDALTDPLVYDALKGTAGLTDGVASVAGTVGLVPVCRPVASAVSLGAAGTGFVSRVAVKLAFDEGEWEPLAKTLALGAVGASAGSLRQAAVARGVPSAHLGPTGFATSRQRLVAGAKAHARANAPWRAGSSAGGRRVAAPTARAPETAMPLPEKARRAAQRAVDRRVEAVRTDWQSAARTGQGARAMLLTAWGLRAGEVAYTKSEQASAAYERGARARRHWMKDP